jgi:hypothetical protein
MTTRDDGRALDKHASVTVEAAAQLVDVDAATIRHWSEIGSIEIEVRGDMEVVRLDQVRALSSSPQRRRPSSRRGALRDRLRGTVLDTLSVVDLQALARDRDA